MAVYVRGYTSEALAQAASATLWEMARPTAVRDPRDVTMYAVGWTKHVTEDEWALVLPDGLHVNTSRSYERDPSDEALLVRVFADAASAIATIVAQRFFGIDDLDENAVSQAILEADGWFTVSGAQQENAGGRSNP